MLNNIIKFVCFKRVSLWIVSFDMILVNFDKINIFTKESKELWCVGCRRELLIYVNALKKRT